MRVRVTGQARNDLIRIWHFINESGAGPETADRILRKLNERVQQLKDFPHRGVPRPELQEDARMLIVGRWVVFYRVVATGVSISRIVDGARDMSRISLGSDGDL